MTNKNISKSKPSPIIAKPQNTTLSKKISEKKINL